MKQKDSSYTNAYIQQLSKSMGGQADTEKRLTSVRNRLVDLYCRGEYVLFRQEAELAGLSADEMEEGVKRLLHVTEDQDYDKREVLSSLRTLSVDKHVDTTFADLPDETRQRIKEDALELYNVMDQTIEIILSNPAVVDNYQKVTSKPIDSFFTRVEYAEGELRQLYGKMIWDQWIDDNQTSEDEFVYFFSGHGDPPRQRIRWMKSSVSLSFFIKRMTSDTRIWKMASMVFEIRDNSLQFLPVDGDKLNVQYYTAKRREKYLGETLEVDRLLSSF